MCTLQEWGINGRLNAGEYSREWTQISRFFEESAIFWITFKGFEGVKFMPQLHIME